MSLTLTLQITPDATGWIGSATLEEDSKDRYTQKELAMRLKLTGNEVTSAMGDLSFVPANARYGWYDYAYETHKNNRDICLMHLKAQTVSLLKYLSKHNIDVYVRAIVLHDYKLLGWSLSKTTDIWQEIEQWNG